jgi:hypothetical protein
MTSQIIGSDFTSGAQLPQYANGRVLTATDLATGQATLRARDALIGQAAGHGVVTGLWVTASATSLTIASGLGISPSGQPVQLASTITLPLAMGTLGSATSAAAFTACASPSSGSAPAITAGEYLLTVRPASQPQGQAPLANTPGSAVPAGCTPQWTVQGVSFNAIALQVPNGIAGVTVTADNQRNLVAHWCFGSSLLAQVGADPFSFNPAYRALDGLDPADLTTGDVPLAVFSWDGRSITNLDNWSVRRRITTPDPVITDPVSSSLSAVISDRRVADGQARFLQFQDQASDLVATGSASTTAAPEIFGLLPPVGLLPVGLMAADSGRIPALKQVMSLGSPISAFNPTLFFGDLARLGGMLSWELADLFLQQSWHRDPVPTTPASGLTGQADGSAKSTVPFTYYYVIENVLASQQLPPPDIVERYPLGRAPMYVVFVKNYLPISAPGPRPDLSYLVPLLLDDMPGARDLSYLVPLLLDDDVPGVTPE